MDITQLKDLLAALTAQNVQKFSDGTMRIEFFPSKEIEKTLDAESINNLKSAVKAQEDKLPPDLRADDLMNGDKVLFWSGDPGADDGTEMPLAGDVPLDGAGTIQ